MAAEPIPDLPFEGAYFDKDGRPTREGQRLVRMLNILSERTGGAFGSALPLKSYTVAQLATLEPTGPALAYCSNETGGAVPVFWTGSDWRRTTDRAIVS